MGGLTERALERMAAETSVSRLLPAACVELVRLLGAEHCSISRIIGDLLVELSNHHTSGGAPALELYLASDYPLTQEVIEQGEIRAVRRSDPAADPAESALLGRLGYDSLLMLPLRSRGRNWGLVEIYSDDRAFTDDEIAAAETVVRRLGELLVQVEDGGTGRSGQERA